MGQYYEILLKDENGFHHFDRSVDGQYMMAKLMEHSWHGNWCLGAICKKLYKNICRLWWVGDYSNDAPLVNNMSEEERGFVYHMCYGEISESYDVEPLSSKEQLSLEDKIIVNHTKGLVLRWNDYYKRCKCDDGSCIHPLSLLTAMGNGCGGGDYYGINEYFVGAWAGDEISIEDDDENLENTMFSSRLGYKIVDYTFR